MNYKITYTKRFIKNLKRLNAAERAQLKKKLEILEMDPLYPSLRTKRIQGTVDLFEFSVNMDAPLPYQCPWQSRGTGCSFCSAAPEFFPR